MLLLSDFDILEYIIIAFVAVPRTTHTSSRLRGGVQRRASLVEGGPEEAQAGGETDVVLDTFEYVRGQTG